jgi:hypothetical protein
MSAMVVTVCQPGLLQHRLGNRGHAHHSHLRSWLTCHEVVPCRPVGLKLSCQPEPAAAAAHQQAGSAAVQPPVGCSRQVLLACTMAKVQEEVVLLQC